jgi:hypothetical protein
VRYFRFAAVGGLAVWMASAAMAAPDTKLAGTYCGSMFAGERLTDMVLTVSTDEKGAIRGSYRFMERGYTIDGGLMATTIGEDHKADFRWIDKYGRGRLVATFAADRGIFFGLWGPGEGDPTYPWFGWRCSDLAAPGVVS